MIDHFSAAQDAAIKGRIRKALQRSGCTLEDLATATSESYRNVRNWVSGPTRVPAHFIARVVAVIPVNGTWVLTGQGPRESAHPDLDGLVLKIVQAAGAVRQERRRPERDKRNRLRKALSALEGD